MAWLNWLQNGADNVCFSVVTRFVTQKKGFNFTRGLTQRYVNKVGSLAVGMELKQSKTSTIKRRYKPYDKKMESDQMSRSPVRLAARTATLPHWYRSVTPPHSAHKPPPPGSLPPYFLAPLQTSPGSSSDLTVRVKPYPWEPHLTNPRHPVLQPGPVRFKRIIRRETANYVALSHEQRNW